MGLVDRVLERIAQLPEPRANLMAEFARAYLHRLTPDGPTSPEALFHEVQGLFEFIETRTQPIAVRAFNPTAAEHGYESTGTVVEVHTDDSPFLVDSITNELEAHGLQVTRVLHPVIGTVRDSDGHLKQISSALSAEGQESVEHYVTDRLLFSGDLPALERALVRVLGDVKAAVRDWEAMLDKIPRMITLTRQGEGAYPQPEVDEAVAFLEWLRQDNFVFLGYREYQMLDTPQGEAVQCVPDSGLGILSDDSTSELADPVLLSSMSPELAQRFREGDLLVISKTNRFSTVHRRAKMDYVGVRVIGEGGKTVAEARLVGLFTSKAYMERASHTPLLRRKLDQIATAENLIDGSHDHKAVVALFESFPKDELFDVPAEDLRRLLMGLLAVQEKARVKLFVRRQLLDRSVRLLVAMPRDRYSTTLAKHLQEVFLDRFNGKSVDYHLTMEAADMAYLHFRVWVQVGQVPDVPYEELEAEVHALTRSWAERVGDVLAERHDHQKARAMTERWVGRFPAYYTSSTELSVAAGDIEHLEQLAESGGSLLVGLQNEAAGPETLTRVALYRRGGKRYLSELTPGLEDLGLRVVEEVPTRLSGEGDLFIHDFGVLTDGTMVDLDEAAGRIAEALTAVWTGETETDSLNRLVLAGGLDFHQVEILRAYRTYWHRVSPTFTLKYVSDTLVSFADITAKLMSIFELRFDPDSDGSGLEELRYEVLSALDAVPSLDQDRILRGFLRLIDATVRTNAYRVDRTALAFKFRSADVPDMPAPVPFMEVFVAAPEVEGIHLRAGPVARGGIRWSDRREDYRTEVLGLMKAQVTKNAVIVPTGAKGGFVLRRPPQDSQDMPQAVAGAYEIFIRGLLDVTDNLVDGRLVHPDRVRVHDGDDPYLVVAADKGTATFSDLANQIAARFGFWLGDAFASGGSSGYDHKALGITARGAWKSLERHFLDLGIDPYVDPFTAVGIGDMSGDVFGNGMLVSDQTRLVAAFDHRHIFVDPEPDPAASFAERQRLFDLPKSSWADYDADLISEGGGVFPRSAKKIELSPQARAALGTDQTTVDPNQLIGIILRAPVDLLWNGGIGTYVKGAHQSNEEVGDRTNDAVRINGADLRCKVVVEGGNLGLTQQGRIEYAEAGGKINTDFIDNSGGVNCSDREVNLKILLGLAEGRGEIERPERDELLAAATDEVVARILHDSLEQAQMLALEGQSSVERMDAYEQLMVNLEQKDLLDRDLEGLPPSEEMVERAQSARGMTSPELSVLLAYSKRILVDSLLASDLPDSPHLSTDLAEYFPSEISKRFEHLVPEHPLHRELISTIIANDVIDAQGSTFISRLETRTGAGAADIVRAYRTAREVAGTARRREVEELFGRVDPETWRAMINANDQLLASLTRWYLQHGDGEVREAQLEKWAGSFATLEEVAAELGPPQWQEERGLEVHHLEAAGVSAHLARRIACLPDLVHAPNIIDLARHSGRDLNDVGRVFYRIGQALQLDALKSVLNGMIMSNSWQRWAAQTVEDDLIAVRRTVAERVLEEAGNRSGDDAVDHFLAEHAHALARLARLTQRLRSGSDDDLAPLIVAIRQVEALAG